MREVWILLQHAPVLLKVEKLLRKPNAHPLIHALKGVSTAMSNPLITTQSLLPGLQSGELGASGRYSFSLLEGLEPVIQATAHDYGDVNVFIAMTGGLRLRKRPSSRSRVCATQPPQRPRAADPKTVRSCQYLYRHHRTAPIAT